MSLKLILRPEAEADALEAYRWYSEQLPGLGDDFLSEVERALETIGANPEASRANFDARLLGVWPRHDHRGRPLNSVVRANAPTLTHSRIVYTMCLCGFPGMKGSVALT